MWGKTMGNELYIGLVGTLNYPSSNYQGCTVAGLKFDICLCIFDNIICFGRDMQELNTWLQAILNLF